MKEEIIWSIVYLVIGTALHYFKKFRDSKYPKKKERFEEFLKKDHTKMEFNIRKTYLEMYATYNRWLTVFKWFFWLGAVYILYSGICKNL